MLLSQSKFIIDFLFVNLTGANLVVMILIYLGMELPRIHFRFLYQITSMSIK